MAKLALIGGHSILGAEPGEGFGGVSVDGERGRVDVFEDAPRDLVLMQRHGLGRYTTAAQIDHPRNLLRARRARLRPDPRARVRRRPAPRARRRAPSSAPTTSSPSTSGSRSTTATAASGSRASTRPGGADPAPAWERGAEPELIDGGVYWQAIGPRFETPAEIRLIAAHADVIGMTIASECILAGELGIPYAAVCVVDNLANGIADGRSRWRSSRPARTRTGSACSPRSTPWCAELA